MLDQIPTEDFVSYAELLNSWFSYRVKGIVHPKIKTLKPRCRLASFRQIHPGVVLNNVLVLPIFIMAVIGGLDFEAQKSASIHH